MDHENFPPAQQVSQPSAERSDLGTPADWFAAQMPTDWFVAPVVVSWDREEIVVIGELAEGIDPIAFREASRAQRVQIAHAGETWFGRKVSWGVQQGERRVLFTHLSIPVMTRLRQPERTVLDALITGGIARSRSEAMAWCVALVGEHQGAWLGELVDAAEAVRKVRERGPK